MSGTTTTASVVFQAPGEDGIGTIVIDRPDDSVNAVNLELIEDLSLAVRAARAQPDILGVIVSSAKENQWVAGADLKMVTQVTDPRQIEAGSRRFQAVIDELAWLPCTTVAAINGTALGGGLELALACDYRVAADLPGVLLGQPEVNLGLLPAGGGTQRLPRLIGLQRALDLILSGRRLNARRARRAGLLDDVVHATVLERAARAWAAKPKRPLDRPVKLGFNLQSAADLAEQTPAGRSFIYRQARHAVVARTHGHYPAPLKALEAVQIGFEQGLAAGLEAESRAFGELALGTTAKNLIWLFMATQRQKRQSDKQAQKVERLGVVGAGFMGAAIAEVAAVAGLPVRLKDVQPAAVAIGLGSISQMVERLEARQRRDVLQRLSGTTDYSGFPGADLVIEAVFEDLGVKHNVVKELEAQIRPDAVIASNTSALPIKDIASAAQHPERIVGMHFFSPAERMPLLEVIRPASAADWAVNTAVELGTRMGKTVIVVGDTPGFYTSRVLGVMMNEATILLGEGARIEDVDRAMTDFGFPVGPFVLYDEVGLQVAQHAGETVGRAFGDRLPDSGIVQRLVAAGQTGRKAGAGFYVWRKPTRMPGLTGGLVKRSNRTPNPKVYAMVGKAVQRNLGDEGITERLALLFVNEALRCLEEGVLRSPTDGDLGAVLGVGFPPFLGGPFHYADALGHEHLRGKLQTLADAHGSRFAPSSLLIQGGQFFKE